MPNSNTKITLKRTTKNAAQVSSEPLFYGEPAFIEEGRYLVIGNDVPAGDNSVGTIDSGTFFEGVKDATLRGKTVFANTNNICVTQDGNEVSTSKISPINIDTLSPGETTKYYLVSCADTPTGYKQTYIHSYDTSGIYITNNGVFHGGAWNDYAERRKCDITQPGYVVCEAGDGTLTKSKFKLQSLPYVISDTYGMSIGSDDTSYVPVAVAGRVLVYVSSEVAVGDVLCAGENGYATKMTRQEIINYPDRILGVVSEIPKYEYWNNIKINGRIWITIK